MRRFWLIGLGIIGESLLERCFLSPFSPCFCACRPIVPRNRSTGSAVLPASWTPFMRRPFRVSWE